MENWWIRNVRLVFPGKQVVAGSVTLEAGVIKEINPQGAPRAGYRMVEGQGKLLTPGLIDVHTHGIHEFPYEADLASLCEAGKIPGRYGTTTVIPTLCPQKGPAMLSRMRAVAEALPAVTGVNMPGLHLEGPFMGLAGAACATLPGDVGLTNEIIDACLGRISIMSISPELENIVPVIERLREQGIVVFMTHTRATPAQTQRAIDAGAVHATHFYDVFPAPDVTEPGVRPAGVVETVLANKHVSVDFIADGVHVDPVVIRAYVAAKGWRGVVAITDSNIGAGLPPGEYDTPWGFRVKVRQGDAARTVGNNLLAGSALTLNEAMRNLMSWLDQPPARIWAMGTVNPARLLGLTRKGVLAPGRDADVVLWNEDLTPAMTWLGGELVFCHLPP
jgi:N-acetylglucosamine-6-phosphate deacetylase